MPKISKIVEDLDLLNHESWKKLSPKHKDCIKDILEKVETDKSNANFLVKFDTALENLSAKYGIGSGEIESFIDKVILESIKE